MAGGGSNTLRAVLKELGWSRTRLVAELRRQAIYRKLEVTSRAEAVAHARHLRLLPGSTPTDRQSSHPDESQAR